MDVVDELYIQYNEEGERVDQTTDIPAEAWLERAAWAGNGSGSYQALNGIAGSGSAPDSRQAGDVALRAATFDPDVHVNGEGDDAGVGPKARAGIDPADDRGRATGAAEDPWDHDGWRAISQRSAESRARSHRHCPGCNGHRYPNSGFWVPALRAVAGWSFGGFGFAVADIGIDPARYCVLTATVLLMFVLCRPAWRDYVLGRDLRTKGGER